MLPDRVSNPGPLTYESDALPIALRGPAVVGKNFDFETLTVDCIIYTVSLCTDAKIFRQIFLNNCNFHFYC